VALNPFTELPALYGSDVVKMYRGRNIGDLDPHIYAIAEEAFTKMSRSVKFELSVSVLLFLSCVRGVTVTIF
jgi:hypothetical protein